MDILIWKIEGQMYATDLKSVDYIILAAEVTPLPHAPEYILGALNIHGDVIPVINARKLLGVQARDIEAADYFILCLVHGNRVALWVDSVEGLKSYTKNELVAAGQALPNIEAIEHVLKQEDQLILLYNLEALIPPQAVSAI